MLVSAEGDFFSLFSHSCCCLKKNEQIKKTHFGLRRLIASVNFVSFCLHSLKLFFSSHAHSFLQNITLFIVFFPSLFLCFCDWIYPLDSWIFFTVCRSSFKSARRVPRFVTLIRIYPPWSSFHIHTRNVDEILFLFFQLKLVTCEPSIFRYSYFCPRLLASLNLHSLYIELTASSSSFYLFFLLELYWCQTKTKLKIISSTTIYFYTLDHI